MPLIKRITKGSPLTFAEGDGNLDYLDNFIKIPIVYSEGVFKTSDN